MCVAELTQLIARKVSVKPGRVLLGKFANNETQVQLTDNVRGKDVYVIQVSSNYSIKPSNIYFFKYFVLFCCRVTFPTNQSSLV